MPNSSVLAEAFWHLLSQPHILRLFAATFVVAVSLPFAVAYGYRLWRVLRARWLVVPPSKESKQKVADETVPPCLWKGAFNSTLMDDLCLRRGDGTMEEIRGARMVTFEGDEANDASKFAGNSSKSDETGAIGDGSGQPSMDNSNGIVEVPGQMTNGNGDPDSEFDDVIEEEEEQEEDLFNMDGKETDPLILREKKKKKGGKKVDASWKIKPPNRVPDPETLAALKKLEEGGLHGKLATARLRAKSLQIESQMTLEEREKERQARHQQMAQILEMMQQHGEKFGDTNESELEEQLKMYNV